MEKAINRCQPQAESSWELQTRPEAAIIMMPLEVKEKAWIQEKVKLFCQEIKITKENNHMENSEPNNMKTKAKILLGRLNCWIEIIRDEPIDIVI